MIYEKTLEGKKYKSKTIVIEDFSGGVDTETNPELIKYKKACSLFNFVVKNGRLEEGYGLSPIKLPASYDSSDCTLSPTFNFSGSYQGIWLYKYFSTSKNEDSYDLILYGDNGYLYWIGIFDNNPNIYRLYEISLTSKPIILNYRMYDKDYLLICNETEGMISWDGDTVPKEVSSAPNIRSICKHGTRLFALTEDRYSIRYSSELDPTNWLVTSSQESSGIIRLADQLGEMNKIVSFLGGIYVFRDGGITKVKFYEEDNSYEVSQVFFSGSKIYADSIAIGKEKIYFATRDGVYSFDGITSDKIELNLDSLFVSRSFTFSKGVYHKDKYYIACYLNYLDNNNVADDTGPYTCVNNVLICLDTTNDSYDIFRGVDIIDMLPLDVGQITKLLILTRKRYPYKIMELTTDGLYDGATFKQWQSEDFSLGEVNKTKIIKSFTVYTKHDIDVEIKTDCASKYVYVYGKNKPQKINCNLMGGVASIKLRSSDNKADIRSFALEVWYEC